MRGNMYGLKHDKLTADDDDEFWNFTWTDTAARDLPAMISYVLAKTSQPSLVYIAHGLGALIGLAELSKMPELAAKIKLMIAFAPMATLGHIKSPIKYLADVGASSKQQVWYTLFGRKDFQPSETITEWLATEASSIQGVDKRQVDNCMLALMGPCGVNSKVTSKAYLKQVPAGTSVKTMAHLAQLVKIKTTLQMFDYGTETANLKVYNEKSPPQYDLAGVEEVPIAMYWSGNDWLASGEDVSYLRNKLGKKIVDDFEVNKEWNHLDFILAPNAKILLYDRVLDLIKKY
jgi:lysosomal acid lipase/cholesteryl ester hydrolase